MTRTVDPAAFHVTPRPHPWALCAIGLVLSWPLVAAAQYKVVGPDGKVTYTDRPPPQTSGKASALPPAAGDAGTANAGLPFELRQVASRYPVTLYTSAGCDSCDVGRQYLRQRGIPYVEKVAGGNDGEALVRATGSRAIPALTIGGQVLQGYSADSWASYLDAAGYPKQSRLPGSYTPPPPSPLVAARPAAAEVAAPVPAPPPPEPAPPPAPGGIRF